MAFTGYGAVRSKIVIDSKIIEQEYGGNFISYDKRSGH